MKHPRPIMWSYVNMSYYLDVEGTSRESPQANMTVTNYSHSNTWANESGRRIVAVINWFQWPAVWGWVFSDKARNVISN